MTIIDKQNTTGGQGGSSSQEHGAGVGIMAEQIMQNAAGKTIPAGYQQTEVGVIPEDWDVVPFFDSISIASGQVSPLLEPYASMTLVAPDHIESNTGRLLAKQSAKEQNAISGKYYFCSGDTIYSKIRPYLKKAIYAEFNGLCSADMYPLRAKEHLEPKLILPLILSERFSAYAESVSVRSGMPKINRVELADFSFALPRCLKEQTAIANVLSDSDALIDALEQLIAKKQAIKSATMQQLLTGRTRLPAFALRPDGTPKGYKPSELGDIPEDWEVCEMGSLGFTYGGLTGKSKKDFGHGNGLYVPFTNVMANIIVDIAKLEKVHVAENQNNVINGDLLFNGSSETPEEVCFCSLVNHGVSGLYLNSFCFGFRRKDGAQYIPIYLSYWFRSSIGRKAVSIMAQGSTRYNISKKQFLKLSITLPSIEEQTAIATILSDMDNELQALTQKLDKARALKQGMMQQLLTGKIRLPLAAGA